MLRLLFSIIVCLQVIKGTTITGDRWDMLDGFNARKCDLYEDDIAWCVADHDVIFRYDFREHTFSPISGGLDDVSVGPAGVWGVNRNDLVYYRDGTYGNPTSAGTDWIQVTGQTLVHITVGKAMVVGLTSGQAVYKRAGISAETPTGTSWEKLEGACNQLDISGDDELYCSGGGQPRHYDFEEDRWNVIAGNGIVNVAIGPAGFWVTNTQNKLYYFTGTTYEGALPKYGHISVGRTMMLLTDAAGIIWIRKGITKCAPAGDNAWYSISKLPMTQCVIARDVALWCIHTDKVNYHYDLETRMWRVGDGGALADISAGGNGLFVTNIHGKVYYRKGSYGQPEDVGGTWQGIGSLRNIGVGDDAQIATQNPGNKIFKQTHSTECNPVGGKWTQITGEATVCDMYSNFDTAWCVGPEDQIYKYQTETNDLKVIPGGLNHISIGYAGVWGVNAGDNIYYRNGTYANSESEGNTWITIPGGLKDIDVGMSTVVGVNRNNDVYLRHGMPHVNNGVNSGGDINLRLRIEL